MRDQLKLGKGRVVQRSKSVASVRVWPRKRKLANSLDAVRLFYVTVRWPDGSRTVRSSCSQHRSAAEELAAALLKSGKPTARGPHATSHESQLLLGGALSDEQEA